MVTCHRSSGTLTQVPAWGQALGYSSRQGGPDPTHVGVDLLEVGESGDSHLVRTMLSVIKKAEGHTTAVVILSQKLAKASHGSTL